MKKLIPAICMLLISACMFGTSTFAWFSMNNTVTVSGMEVTAVADGDDLETKPDERFLGAGLGYGDVERVADFLFEAVGHTPLPFEGVVAVEGEFDGEYGDDHGSLRTCSRN